MRLVSLCSGYGGLDLAAESAVGAELVGWSEVDPDAATVMATHWPDADPLGDLTTRTTWPAADIVTAGFPCQPVSLAGRRRGDTDERWIWPEVLDAIGMVGPRLVLLENVAGLTTLGGGRVVGDLAARGYRVQWSTLRASDIGAPHRRNRIFIVAIAANSDDQFRSEHNGTLSQPGDLTLLPTPTARLGDARGMPGERLAASRMLSGRRNLDDVVVLLPTPTASMQNYDEEPMQFLNRRERVRQSGINGNGVGLPLGVAVRLLPTPTTEPTTGNGHARNLAAKVRPDRWGDYAGAVAHWETILGRPAPDPLNDSHQLAPHFAEWMMGLDDGWVTGPVSNRRRALRLLGNGVVPQQAATAIHALTQEMP